MINSNHLPEYGRRPAGKFDQREFLQHTAFQSTWQIWAVILGTVMMFGVIIGVGSALLVLGKL